MTEKKRMSELTDARFKIPANVDVLTFVHEKSGSAHSDVGSLLFAAAREVDGVEAYCPLPRSFAYVVLHTPDNHIIALAFGQRSIAFRLRQPAFDAALASGGQAYPEIGHEWVCFDIGQVARSAVPRGLPKGWVNDWAMRAIHGVK